MLLLPHLREFLMGPAGAGLLFWFFIVVSLGTTKRLGVLSILLTATTLVLVILAVEAFEISAKPYSPNRDVPVLMSGLFISFSLAAFLIGAVALGMLSYSLRERFRNRQPAKA